MISPAHALRAMLVLSGIAAIHSPLVASAPDRVSFNKDVRPILSDKCFACHGFDSKKRQAELRLDTAEGATTARDGQSPIVPGQLDRSQLWQRITSTDADLVMPPPSSHKELTDDERRIIRQWIEEGAEYQKHWAFETPVRVQPPVKTDGAREANAIDAFIADRLAREGLSLSPEADRRILIRRVAFALTGLPPTVEETEAWLADSSADAYERMVQRYLDSQYYGEEMARHWLDVARYADTHGMHLDNERQTWAYRDWVVGAFNRNMPFDQFTIEQLAGDKLDKPTREQIIATGFNRCNVTTSEGGSIGEELLYRYAVDRASTTMQTWLGLTGGCAVCHDHKFDPITQKDFYAFYAFFNSAADPAMDGNALLTQPVLKLDTEGQREQIARLNGDLAQLQSRLDQELEKVEYVDPASQPDSENNVQSVEVVWMEDGFPSYGNLHKSADKPTQFVTREQSEPVFSGLAAVKRTDAGVSQDVWDNAKTPLRLPAESKLIAYVYLDPANPPRAIMLQYFKKGWEHRAVWGDYEAIPWGAANTNERVAMGALPECGAWTRLEFAAEKVGLAAGDEIKGFALTQFGGTVYWDHVGVTGTTNPAKDPTMSFLAWWKGLSRKDANELPTELRKVAKDGPEKTSSEDAANQDLVAKLRKHYLQEFCQTTREKFAPLNEDRRKLEGQRKAIEDAIPGTFVFNDLPKPRESFVMMRGSYDKPGDKVDPNVPAIFPPMQRADASAPATRLDLARWLIAPENPLVARVTVNRLWQQFLGTGLVKSSYDFGTQGDMPSHPELLDWLATEFQSTGWDVKRMVRMIVCSKTFRQSSQITPDLYRLDPENRLYARGPRFRLDAEQIRDNALFVSGLINLEMGGKGVRTYQPDNIWEPVGFGGSNTRNYKRDSGPALYRRSIYTFFKRTAPPPFMVNFDAPNREQFCTKREKSNTPLQALQLMNDVQHVEAARALAERMMRHGGESGWQRIAYLYRTVLARNPDDFEMTTLQSQLTTNLERYRADVELAKKLIAAGESKPDEKLDAAELAAYTLVANTLLNLDETLTRN